MTSIALRRARRSTVPRHVKQAMIDWFGPVLYEYYAATEGGATLVTSSEWKERPGTVGKAIEGTGVRVLDESKHDCAPGVMGKVYLMAPEDARFKYFKAPEKTSGAYHENFFTLGDQGHLDADGYLFLTGRDAETIISGGVNIYPQEIDDLLLQFPGVQDVCTIGVPTKIGARKLSCCRTRRGCGRERYACRGTTELLPRAWPSISAQSR